MKKLLAVLMAGMLLLGVCATAYAANGGDDPNSWTSDETSFSFNKTYVNSLTAETKTASSVFPAETLTFSVVKAAGNTNPDDTMITVASATNTYTAAAAVNTITVNVPAYSKVGQYEYTITEVAGNTQGVTYDTTTALDVAVLVTYNYTDKKLDVVAEVKQDASGNKQKDLYNQYDVGTLTVSKTVTGNLGDQSKYFGIDVTFTPGQGKAVWSDISISSTSYTGTPANPTVISGNGWTQAQTVTVYLKHGETITFSNVPAGVTYAVAEQAVHTLGGLNGDEGYTATYTGQTDTIAKDATKAAAVTNEKKTNINTGISLDTLPYIVALVVVAVGVVLFIVRRRRREDD